MSYLSLPPRLMVPGHLLLLYLSLSSYLSLFSLYNYLLLCKAVIFLFLSVLLVCDCFCLSLAHYNTLPYYTLCLSVWLILICLSVSHTPHTHIYNLQTDKNSWARKHTLQMLHTQTHTQTHTPNAAHAYLPRISRHSVGYGHT